tara:strand:- start:473 stop:1066 length:594 start_codon:yes stop_codon:yes gene_type:complete
MTAPILTRLTTPTIDPVSLAEMKTHLRVDGDDEDAAITDAMADAAAFIETHCNIALAPASWEILFDTPASLPLTLPIWPVTSVDSVTYSNGDSPDPEVEASIYRLVKGQPATMHLAYDATWPSMRTEAAALRVLVTAGWPGDGASPEVWTGPLQARRAIKLVVGHWYANRETVNIGSSVSELPFAAGALLAQLRLFL